MRTSRLWFLVIAAACNRPQTPSAASTSDTSWLVASVPARDAVHASDSEASLRARYGDSNVVAGDVEIGEGETERGTILFPGDASRRLAILWTYTLRRTNPRRVAIDATPTRWIVFPGVTIGTSLAELERLNGRPFRLYGFHFDYAGTVDSWEGGRLDQHWPTRPGSSRFVWLRLRPDSGANDDLVGKVTGDRVFSSADAAMRQLNPKVYDLFVVPR